jgi:hypothetical protein
MLSDPQTLNSLPFVKVKSGENSSDFVSGDGLVHFITKQNTTAKRFRREVRLQSTKVATDPISAVNVEAGASVYLVIDEPRAGYSDAELKDLVTWLYTWLSASSYANTSKVLLGEF